ncbi:TetR/AcrR family transcriptional regulator, mexJK operon transcriptional repressor [Sinosporangium album]|uniref:TetR/AcrR family transcriptional regulator, mexJK operon transcriptional repressor n=1 Tax=Sinosporangium album TaxID=504805 RepID=A0A1G7ZF88_9ACTN|nr:TetR/AcrR family transcriptional regulator [Sinosporangium album]SDH07443.1 TetR/AcrR family transcriptional regulator, mexJK operon transcriptional repressor [Sinosporangium album]
MTAVEQSRRRGRSEQKHTAVLDAAQALFLADGYERTSVDAIAARAEVSKRTVYDHFGDKERIYGAVMDRVSERLLVTVKAAIEEELPEGCDLRSGLLSFARRVATDTFSSSDFTLFRRLLGMSIGKRRITGSVRNAPKELFVGRMASFFKAGAIITENPWRAAEHFIALTFLLALDTLDPAVEGAWNEVDEVLVDGVDTFLRAYT